VNPADPRDRLIYFIHIQKTSGTSIRGYFQQAFGRTRCLWHAPKLVTENKGNVFNIAKTDPARFDACRVIGGHIGWRRIPRVILDRSPIFVSAIRDPVARVVSHYQHIRSDAGHVLHQEIAGMSLFDAIRRPGFAAVSDRMQIEDLCGGKDLDRFLDVARANSFIIGKQERIEAFLLKLSTVFDLPLFLDIRQNVSAPGYQADIEAQPDYEAAVSHIAQMNQEEYSFYNSFADVWSNVGDADRAV
jgi:hypothetical protein